MWLNVLAEGVLKGGYIARDNRDKAHRLSTDFLI
jgi:hypothetical protein